MDAATEVSQKRVKMFEVLKTVVLPLALVFLTEPLYREPLYAQSQKLAPELQKMESLKPLMELLSGFGAGRTYAFFLVLVLNVMPKPASLYIWCGVFFAMFTMNQLKSLYGEPRPYWVTDEVIGAKCGTGFGNPSGHMLNNCFFWGSLYLHVFFEGRAYSALTRFVSTIVVLAVTGLMALSRVYLGAHTLNEVLFGTLIGFTMAFIGHLHVKPLFWKLPQALHSADEPNTYHITWLRYAKAFLVSFALPMTLATLTWRIRREDNESALYTSDEWHARMVKSGCTPQDLDPAIILHNRHYEHSALIAIATGALFGQFFEGQFLVNRGLLNSSQWLWNQTTVAATIARFLLTVILLAPCVLPMIVFKDFITDLQGNSPVEVRIMYCILLVQTLPSFLTGFTAFGLLRYVSSKLHLDSADAIGKEFEPQEDYFVQEDFVVELA